MGKGSGVALSGPDEQLHGRFAIFDVGGGMTSSNDHVRRRLCLWHVEHANGGRTKTLSFRVSP